MTNTVVGIIKIIVLGKSNNPKLCFTIYVAKEIWLSERLLNLDSSHQLEQKCQQGDNFFSARKKKQNSANSPCYTCILLKEGCWLFSSRWVLGVDTFKQEEGWSCGRWWVKSRRVQTWLACSVCSGLSCVHTVSSKWAYPQSSVLYNRVFVSIIS